MTPIVKPHGGGELKPLLLKDAALERELAHAATLPKISISPREAADLLLFGIGAYTPLDGFMGSADWRSVCDGMRLSSNGKAGIFWPLPITMSTDKATAEHIAIDGEIALYDPENDVVLATMRVTEKYRIDKARECLALFGTADKSHPGVGLILRQDDINIAGPVKILSQGDLAETYGDWYRTPADVRAELESHKLGNVAAFRSSDPRRLKAAELQQIATTTGSAIAIFSQLGGFGYGDGSAGARRQALDDAVDAAGLKDKVIRIGHPPTLRPAGSRKTRLHALLWKNYGCGRMIFVGAPEYSGDGVIGDEIPTAVLDIESLLPDYKS